jgi:hypothetical protein
LTSGGLSSSSTAFIERDDSEDEMRHDQYECNAGIQILQHQPQNINGTSLDMVLHMGGGSAVVQKTQLDMVHHMGGGSAVAQKTMQQQQFPHHSQQATMSMQQQQQFSQQQQLPQAPGFQQQQQPWQSQQSPRQELLQHWQSQQLPQSPPSEPQQGVAELVSINECEESMEDLERAFRLAMQSKGVGAAV